MAKIPATELILNPNGSIYHLNLLPHEIAEKVVFVGDPERVSTVTQHFDKLEFTRQKREFCTSTGWLQGQRITVLSTGIGTDNIDIVFNELDALVNIDFENRTIKEELTSLKVMRLGTCGGLQKEIPVGSIVNSQYALGLEGLMEYYQSASNATETELKENFATYLQTHQLRLSYFYATECSASGYELLAKQSDIYQGITLTAKGFYAPQGRSLGRVGITHPNIIDICADFQYLNSRVTNLEMETAGILALGKAFGHECLSLSVILANRASHTFSQNPEKDVEKLVEKGVELLLKW
ncbi:MAG: nucleoside phosphorylase [Bacteroidia bacterium]